ncbi:MAG TPA: short-chain dehydrogenase [Cyanobacteria bacterium UBA11149]|nr:short-chain dehydrogenase [Cyanobacteria bacterium UBA11367]HBE59883.1 short-chain dehydrogenase [Cyanobacteria bacterium UBA11366]HBR75216.1 short-chain dehydrogenase [Cyanobacteria bacterium UBA11159]HBS68760.1 short-chain dehydrogenase [Cyanobacteria bacterium UBA11153]HBW92117.1 short-chain dehydrogenase [Cyanobacteria bacterium UBA11149]HCA95953.1 short-chain dehydrogenase [Cyanobacteria bacterium UBA9226]
MTSSIKHRALITGASSGIGKATALAFAKAGIDVALVSRSQEKLAEVVTSVKEIGVEGKAYPLDLAKIEEVKVGIEKIAADFAPIDILVNNAGIGYTGLLMDTPLGDWQKVINLNLTSIFQSIQAILPTLRQQKRGTIINVSSIAGEQTFPGWGAYSVSKAGLIALSKILATEERSNGIRVVTICPGAVNTPIWDTVQVELNRGAMLTPEIVAQSILHAVLMPESAVIESMTLMPSAGVL